MVLLVNFPVFLNFFLLFLWQGSAIIDFMVHSKENGSREKIAMESFEKNKVVRFLTEKEVIYDRCT